MYNFFLLSTLTFRSAWSFSDSPMSRFLFTLLIQPPDQLLPMSIIRRPIIVVCWAVCCLEGSMRPSWPSSARSWRSCSSDIRSVQVFQPVRFRSAPGSGPEKWGFGVRGLRSGNFQLNLTFHRSVGGFRHRHLITESPGSNTVRNRGWNLAF